MRLALMAAPLMAALLQSANESYRSCELMEPKGRLSVPDLQKGLYTKWSYGA